jgi:hypothetical protein
MLGKQIGYALGSEPKAYEPDLVSPPASIEVADPGRPSRPPGLIGFEDGSITSGDSEGSFSIGEGEEV